MRKDEDDLDEKSFSFITLLLYLSLLLLLKWPFILNYKEIILIDKYIRKQARGGGGSRGLDKPPLGRKYWGNEKQITLGNSENWLLYFSCSLDYFLINIIRKAGHMVKSASNQHNEKAQQLHEIYHGWESAAFPCFNAYQVRFTCWSGRSKSKDINSLFLIWKIIKLLE